MLEEKVDFLIDRQNLREVRWAAAPASILQPGQARLRVDRFAITSNNITYAVFGEKMRYWNFFPAPQGFGRMPVWGFADVEESRVAGLQSRERIYGYFPISTDLIVSVGKLSASAFTDSSPWRSELAVTYNRYLRVTNDPGFARKFEALQAVFKPLFLTSFLIEDFLAENAFFGATVVLVSSASSKTSLALGYLLNKAARAGVEAVGLTSPSNAAFVRETGYFDRVVTYDAIPEIDVVPSIFVDMAGSGRVRAAVHNHFGNDLRFSSAVGGSHWEDPGRASGLPGPKPTLFFAPTRAEKRQAEWGAGELAQRMATVWEPFCESTSTWLQPSQHDGRVAVEQLYRAVLEGEMSPRSAAMASIHQ